MTDKNHKDYCPEHDTNMLDCGHRHLRKPDDYPVQDTDHMESEARRDFKKLQGME